MYYNRHNLILGFHGCDEEICQRLINSSNEFYFNRNPYDWLGYGMYFWENDFLRAHQWALEKQKQGKIRQPAVLGALIDPGNCCDFMNSKHTKQLARHFGDVKDYLNDLPKNEDVKSDPYKDKLLRNLDCLIIERMHKAMLLEQEREKQQFGFILTPGYDTVRCAFLEGAPVFPGAEIRLKNHIQICVRNPKSILAFFLPRLVLPSILAA